MSTPTYTPLRHRMLREIAAGQITVYVGLRTSLVRGSDEFLKGQQKAAANLLRDSWTWARYPGTGASAPAVLTGVGRALLAEWDAAHPDSTIRTETSNGV